MRFEGIKNYLCSGSRNEYCTIPQMENNLRLKMNDSTADHEMGSNASAFNDPQNELVFD